MQPLGNFHPAYICPVLARRSGPQNPTAYFKPSARPHLSSSPLQCTRPYFSLILSKSKASSSPFHQLTMPPIFASEVYGPLGLDEIRIAQINCASSEDEDIHCHLLHVQRNAPGQYQALSYAWVPLTSVVLVGYISKESLIP